ncbi:MAG: hypothetical protein ACLSDO_01305 [Anaerotruncus colihominis]
MIGYYAARANITAGYGAAILNGMTLQVGGLTAISAATAEKHNAQGYKECSK